MASSLQKLLQKSPSPSTTRFLLTAIQNPNSQISKNPLFFTQPNLIQQPKHDHPLSKLSPFLMGSTLKPENPSTQFESTIFYPNSPFGLLSDPIISIGSIQLEPKEGDDVDTVIWADSVKKKRKRKMNKHKYKKLTKRLKRQS
ncbi:hypothetical protein ACFE04_005690 [Oxalis oulophora]